MLLRNLCFWATAILRQISETLQDNSELLEFWNMLKDREYNKLYELSRQLSHCTK